MYGANMRTRTNLYIGEKEEGFLKILKNFYPDGTTEVVYDDVKSAETLIKKLNAAEYNVIATPAENYVGREYFAVAVGKNAFKKVKEGCKSRFASFVLTVTPDIFLGKKYAEFLYLDGTVYTPSSSKCEECFTALLCAAAEGLGVYYRNKEYPFTDKTLKRLLERAKTILSGEADRENFIKDTLALVKEIVENIENSGVEKFTVSDMAERLGGSVGDYAECACFLHRTLILFTKWNFRDMLITVDRPVKNVGTETYPFYGNDDLIIGEAEMKRIYGFVDGYRSRSGLKTLIEAFSDSVTDKDAFFAEIYNRGIYEGIINNG